MTRSEDNISESEKAGAIQQPYKSTALYMMKAQKWSHNGY